MFAFWIFIQFGQVLKLKNFSVRWWTTCLRVKCLRGMCVWIFCVIEEEGLQLHFDNCGLGCFSRLGCVLVAV